MADLKYIGKNILNHDLIVRKGNVSGSVTSTGSFGRLEIAGNITASGTVTAEHFYSTDDAQVVGTVNSGYGIVNYSLLVNSNSHGGGDFRVKSANNDYMLFSDANQDNISIGASSSPSTLGVTGDITATSHITASGNISGSSTSTGSFGSVVVSDKVQGNLKIGEGIVYNDTNKRLGIGDPVPASPDSELHIKAATPEITLQRTSNSNDSVIDFQGSGGSVGAKIVHTDDGDANSIVFHTHDASTTQEILKITGGSATTNGDIDVFASILEMT